MARLVGVSLRTYDRWEAGETIPRGNILLNLMDLCPDDKTRSLFRAAVASSGPEPAAREQSEVSPPRHGSAAERLRIHFRNSCIEAIRIIYEAAGLGSVAADEKLRTYADELNRTASILARDLVDPHKSQRGVPSNP